MRWRASTGDDGGALYSAVLLTFRRAAASRTLRAWPIRAHALRRIPGVTTGLRPLRRSQSSASPLPDEVALELAQCSALVEDEPAAGAVVSICSVRERRPAPRCSRPLTVSIKGPSERPS